MKIYFAFLSLPFLLISCLERSQSKSTLTIKIGVDSCYDLIDTSGKPINAKRTMRILKNTLTDSVAFGVSLIPKGYVGKVSYLRVGTAVDKAIDPRSDSKYWPATEMICIHKYNSKPFSGEIEVEFEYYKSPLSLVSN